MIMSRLKSSHAILSLPRALQHALLILAISLLPTAYCLLPTVSAQSATATLSGAVVDQNGGVVPGVEITVINSATALERKATTNNDGLYSFPLLPPGSYTITARRDGFSPVK